MRGDCETTDGATALSSNSVTVTNRFVFYTRSLPSSANRRFPQLILAIISRSKDFALLARGEEREARRVELQSRSHSNAPHYF